MLSLKKQSWLLVHISDIPDYTEFAWAARRPRTLEWESDGYFSPPNFVPKYPEPKKWYKRRPGQAFIGSSIHPENCQQVRMLVCLSDALSEAAVDTLQDWFIVAF